MPRRERQAGLRVEVDEQHPVAELGERGPERGDGGRLGDATLLVGDREDAGLRWPDIVPNHAATRLPLGDARAARCWRACPRPARALVTGPTAGIGLSFAHQLAAPRPRPGAGRPRRGAARGGSPPSCARRTASQVEVLRRRPRRPRRSWPRSRPGWPTAARPVDLLVNNAGFGLKERFLDNTVEQEQRHARRAGHRGAAAHPRRARRRWSQRGSGGDHQRVERRRLPAPRHLQRRQGLRHPLQRVGATTTYRDQGVRGDGAAARGSPGPSSTSGWTSARTPRRRWLWLDADRLVARGAARPRPRAGAISVPSKRYKAISAAAQVHADRRAGPVPGAGPASRRGSGPDDAGPRLTRRGGALARAGRGGGGRPGGAVGRRPGGGRRGGGRVGRADAGRVAADRRVAAGRARLGGRRCCRARSAWRARARYLVDADRRRQLRGAAAGRRPRGHRRALAARAADQPAAAAAWWP